MAIVTKIGKIQTGEFQQEGTTPPLSMHDIAEALAAKRAENRVKLKRLAELHQEMADILNSFDA